VLRSVLVKQSPLLLRNLVSPLAALARQPAMAPALDAVVWNPATSEPNFQFSYDRLTAKTTGKTTAGQILARATTSNSSGYFEVLVTAAGAHMIIGLTSSSQATADFVGNANGEGYDGADGNIYRGGTGVLTYATYTSGDVIGVCRKGNFLYFSKNGVWQGGADPSAGTGGIDVSAFASDVLYPAVSTDSAALNVTANFGASAFVYPVPTGVSAWNATATTYNDNLTETAAAADSLASAQTFVSAQTENVTPGDTYAAGNVMAGSLNEAAAAAAALATAVTWGPAQSESAVAADSLDPAGSTFSVPLSESAGAAAALGVELVIPVADSESVAAGDSAAAAQTFVNAQSESSTPADDYAAGNVIAGSLNEAVAPADAAAAAVTFAPALGETSVARRWATRSARTPAQRPGRQPAGLREQRRGERGGRQRLGGRDGTTRRSTRIWPRWRRSASAWCFRLPSSRRRLRRRSAGCGRSRRRAR
jgi:hypothetical protein